jgi:putative protease
MGLFKRTGVQDFVKTEKLTLWAGPFCNIANEAAIEVLSKAGFMGVIADPELSGEDLSDLPGKSPLPLGIVITANWPLSIARTISDDALSGKPFKSPMGEMSVAVKMNHNYYIYPDWKLDLRKKKKLLEKAGYTMFVHIEERLDKTCGLQMKKRSGMWNWDLNLL